MKNRIYVRISNVFDDTIAEEGFTGKREARKYLKEAISKIRERVIKEEFTEKGLEYRDTLFQESKTYGGLLTYYGMHPKNNFERTYFVKVFDKRNTMFLLEDIFL